MARQATLWSGQWAIIINETMTNQAAVAAGADLNQTAAAAPMMPSQSLLFMSVLLPFIVSLASELGHTVR